MASPLKMNTAQRLVKLLARASQADLDAMDAEIVIAEARVKSLRAARDVMAEEILNRGTAPARRRSEPKPPAESNGSGNGSVPRTTTAIEEYTKALAEHLIAPTARSGPRRPRRPSVLPVGRFTRCWITRYSSATRTVASI